MNTKMKIAAGVLAGLVAGVMLVGTAVAAPRMMAGTAYSGYAMMRSFATSQASDRPSIAEMNRFMNRYRTSDGSIDYNRMHSDVTSGKVTPPYLDGSAGAKSTSETRTGPGSLRRGPAMMSGWTSNDRPAGYGMMGSTF